MNDNLSRAINIVIFAKIKEDRDYLRGRITLDNRTIIFFENESICFDNLASIQPHVVIIKTDSREVVWRFFFTLFILNLNPQIIVLSEALQGDIHQFGNCRDFGHSFTILKIADDLNRAVYKTLETVSKMGISNHSQLLVGDSEYIRRIRSIIPKLKKADDPILISGEPGTGKEFLARILGKPEDSNGIFVKIDCNGLSRETDQALIQFHEGQSKLESAALTFLLHGVDKASARGPNGSADADGWRSKAGPSQEIKPLVKKAFHRHH